MARHLEQESSGLHGKYNASLDNHNNLDVERMPPPGVYTKTYDFLLAVINYNNRVDNILAYVDPEIRNLIEAYYGKSVSLQDLSRSTGLGRKAVTNRILNGLNIMWALLPVQIQREYPKEEVIRMKDPRIVSPRTREKIKQATIDHWQNPKYRETILAHIKNRGNDPNIIRGIKEKLIGRPSPFKGRKHTGETIEKIAESVRAMRLKERRNGIIQQAAGPNFQEAQRAIDYLQSNSQELRKYGISEEDVSRHSAQIKDACDRTLTAMSDEDIARTLEKLDLLIRRVQRKITTITPLNFDSDQNTQ